MPEDKRPSRSWWNRCISSCERHKIADDCDAWCGWLWYHGEEEGFGAVRDAYFKSCLEPVIDALAEEIKTKKLDDEEEDALAALVELAREACEEDEE